MPSVSAIASSAVSCIVWPSCQPEIRRSAGTGASFFPAHDGAPLVVELRQVAVGFDDFLVVLAEKESRSSGARTGARELFIAALGDPGHLRGKPLYVVLFLLQEGLRDEQRHIHVLVAGRL